MATSSSATTRSAEQGRTAATLGGIMQEWRQWLAPGVVVTVVLAMGSLQRADIRQLSGKIDHVNTELSADIRDVNGRIDEVNGRIDKVIDQMNNRFDQVNGRIDQLYQLLLP